MKLTFEELLQRKRDSAAQNHVYSVRVHDFEAQNHTRERCVLCGKETDVPVSLPIDRRNCYVEGSGQLCRGCWQRVYGK